MKKFRVWGKICKEMYEPDTFVFIRLDGTVHFPQHLYYGKFEYEADTIGPRDSDKANSLRNPDAVVLMQSTGLKDKNDKEIFEGDILRIHWRNSYKDGFHNVLIKWQTEYNDQPVAEFGYTFDDHDFVLSGDDLKETEAEIIGNVHENPELIK